MNHLLFSAGILSVVLILIHSILGERVIITPVLKLELPRVFGSKRLCALTLRMAWHITSVFGLGIAAYLIYQSNVLEGDIFSLQIFGIMFLACGITSAILAKMKHFSWLVFLIIGALVLLGIR